MWQRGKMLSEPIELHFAGWRATTLDLHAAGWEIQAHEDVAYGQMQLAMRHRDARLTLLTKMATWDYGHPIWQAQQPLRIMGVEAAGANISVAVRRDFAWNFQPVDPVPRWSNDEIVSINDLCHFAPARRLILPEETVPNLLARIVELQQPDAEARYLDLARKAQTKSVTQIIGVTS